MSTASATDRLARTADALRAAGCVWPRDEAALLCAETDDDGELAALVARRAAGEPLEVVLGWAQLLGVRIPVRDGVFLPRRRTEPLLLLALDDVASDRPSVVVDVGTGTGALALVVRARRPLAEVHATELDPAAATLARHTLGVEAVHCGHLLDPLPGSLRGRVDVVLANLPYVPTSALATLPAEARDHEPRVALDGGADGLDHHRRLARAVGTWLAPGGRVFAEVSPEQADACAAVYAAAGLLVDVTIDDDHGVAVVRAVAQPASTSTSTPSDSAS